MGTYQLDHGLSVIETVGTERQLNIAPMSVRGNKTLIPDDMKVSLASKLFEYGFVCKTDAYDQLLSPSQSYEEKNEIGTNVLWKHYGTDDVWEIITRMSIAVFINETDFHARPETSARDQMLMNAVRQKIIAEH